MISGGNRSRVAATLVAVVVAGLAAMPGSAGAAEPIAPAAMGGTPYQPGEAIVRFEPGTNAVERRAARGEADVGFDSTFGVPRAQVVTVDGSVEAAVRKLKHQPGVAYAQPNYRYEELANPPDDTFFNDLWGLSDPALPNPGVSALSAWDRSKGSDEVIAIVDTGIDLTHPDLIGNLWTNPDPTMRDIHGYDFVDDDGVPDDYDFHGTHVAGTAAATAGNGQGIAGVAPDAKVMAVRVLDGDGSGSTTDVAAGIIYAAEHRADVINLSLGSSESSDPTLSNAINVAAANDVVVVAAAGNTGTNNDAQPVLPCALPQTNLICVAALRLSGGLASFSNFGASSVDLAAPGTSILSTQTDYDQQGATEGFESGTTSGWDLSTESGSVPWGVTSSTYSEGGFSATDSPGQDYAPNSDTQLAKSDPVDLTGERGCRIHFDLRRDIQPTEDGKFSDKLLAGAETSTAARDVLPFAGSSGGAFLPAEASISDLDDRPDVYPSFELISDGSQQFDGAYVDNVRVLCRAQTYADAVSPAGNYVYFQGTSMATPHVAGVAALVRAAAPDASAAEVVNAIRAGVSPTPRPDSSRPTVTGGIADACQAIAVATGNATPDCPGSSRVIPPPPPETPIIPAASPPSTYTAFSKPKDKTRPETVITQGPGRVSFTHKRWKRVVFRFQSSEGDSAFLCKIDRGKFHQCWRKLVRWFRPGRHVLRVKAKDAAGNVDRSPVVYRFRIKRARHTR